MRTLGRLLGAVALVAALSARAEIRAVVHEPRDQDVLRGGTAATISWSASDLPAFVEEWEAFLSVDGGEYYAYRITPHLDVALRQFTFEVPNVATSRARILLRAGDEDREIELESSVTFTIERDEARALTVPPLEVEESLRGEPAREGDRGVIEWTDGNRDGSQLTECTALRRAMTLQCASAFEAKPESLEDADVLEAAARRAPSLLARTTSVAATRSAFRHRTGRQVLLDHRRLNI